MEDCKVKVRGFLSRFFKKHELKDDDNIFSLGFVNSLFAMQLVLFIEKEFSVKFENSELDSDNFRSINSICELITKKTN